MKALATCGWTYGELALAVGMRALGEDAETIGGMLGRDPRSVTSVLAFARGLLSKEGWPALLLRNQEAIEQRLRCERPDDPDRIEPFVKRPIHEPPVLPPVRRPGDVTASLLGDPTPEQRARIAARDTHRSGPWDPSRHC